MYIAHILLKKITYFILICLYIFFNRFKCKRCVNGNQMNLPPDNSDCTSDLSQWYHCAKNKAIPDEIISAAWDATKNISFLFHHRSAAKQIDPAEETTKKSKKNKIPDDDDGDYDGDVIDVDNSDDEDYK